MKVQAAVPAFATGDKQQTTARWSWQRSGLVQLPQPQKLVSLCSVRRLRAAACFNLVAIDEFHPCQTAWLKVLTTLQALRLWLPM
jgi:hypothetical protein